MIVTSFLPSILIILSSCVIYYIYVFVRIIWKLQIIGKAINQFPMDDKHWLKGHLHKLSGQGEEGLSYFSELVKKYPKACGLYFINFLKPYVVVHHPDTVKVVLKAAGKKPVFLGVYHYGKKWLGDGLVFSTGKKWKRNRKLLTPTFQHEALKFYIKPINRATDVFLDKLSSFTKCKASFDICGLISHLSLDIILECAFSYKSNLQITEQDHFYTNAVDELGRLWIKRNYEPWKHLDCIYWKTNDGKCFLKHCDLVNKFAMALIKERRNTVNKNINSGESQRDFLGILLSSKDEDGLGLTDEEIKDEINTFIVAGYETVASAISWSLYNLALHQNHQIICQREIDDLLLGRPNGTLTWNDLQGLPYLTKCIKESMRLFGVPFIERELEEDVVIDGKFVPAGSSALILLHNLHCNPDVWDDPSRFDPERFSMDTFDQMDSFSYIPFSAGLRNCIGQAFAMHELKVTLARTLRRFNFTVKEDFRPNRIMALAMKSSNGIYLKASERESQTY